MPALAQGRSRQYRLKPLFFLSVRLLALSLCCGLQGLALAMDFNLEYRGYRPQDPASLSMGGPYFSLGSGSAALISNPAGFAQDGAGIDILRLSPGLYSSLSSLSSLLGANVESLMGNSLAIGNAISKGLAASGVGEGLGLRLGWSGKKIGLGAYAQVGAGGLGQSGRLEVDGAIVVGMAIPFTLGPGVLRLGADLRPSYQVLASLDASSLARLSGASLETIWASLLESPAVGGFALHFDIGASYCLGPFNFGLSLRDISQSMGYQKDDFGDFLSALAYGSLPGESRDQMVNGAWCLPLLSAGMAWSPRFFMGKSLCMPLILVETQDILRLALSRMSFWDCLRLGMEYPLYDDVLALRLGFGGGRLSGGIGLKLGLFNLNASLYNDIIGDEGLGRPRAGLVVDMALTIKVRPTESEVRDGKGDM